MTEIIQLLDPMNVLKESGITPGQYVADLGCGAIGHFVFPAARLIGEKGIAYAVDIQKSVLSAIESRSRLDNIHNVKTLWADIERTGGIRVSDQTFDLTLIINNLSLAKTKDTLAEEARRVTRIGGRLTVIDWAETTSPVAPRPEVRVSPVAASELFSHHGFALDHEFIPGASHWGLVFKRTT